MDGTMPSAARWAVNAIEVYCDPASELNRVRFNSDYADVDVKPENLRMAC
jgi:hypothetical protein